MEHIDHLSSLCSGCGHPRHETFAVENRFAYHAEVLRCHACATRERLRDSKRGNDDFDNAGIYIPVRHVGDPAHDDGGD